MSVDYDLFCKVHNESVSICSDGISGPLLQCDKSLAVFVITHRKCDLTVLDEHNEDYEDRAEWCEKNRDGVFSYEKHRASEQNIIKT